MMFDGEFQIGDSLRATLSHFGRGRRAEDAGTLWAFDAVPLDAWQRDDCQLPHHARKAMLQACLASADGPVICMGDAWLHDADQVQIVVEDVWTRGGEGIVVKAPASLYRRRRTGAWRKVKQAGWSTRQQIL